MTELFRSLSFFVLAGLLEIGGLLGVALARRRQTLWLGLLGAVTLALYGVVATLQPANFGRVYAAYGGIFIAMAVLRGWFIDGKARDRFDLLGAVVALVEVGIIMYWPSA